MTPQPAAISPKKRHEQKAPPSKDVYLSVSVFCEIRFQVAIATQRFSLSPSLFPRTRARTHALISKIKFDKVKCPFLIDFFPLDIKKQNSIVAKLLSVRWNVVAVTAAKINSNSNSDSWAFREKHAHTLADMKETVFEIKLKRRKFECWNKEEERALGPITKPYLYSSHCNFSGSGHNTNW